MGVSSAFRTTFIELYSKKKISGFLKRIVLENLRRKFFVTAKSYKGTLAITGWGSVTFSRVYS